MKTYKVCNGIYFNSETPDKVVRILSALFTNGKRVRVYYGDVATGKSWGESYGVWGTIGRSTGKIKIPLLVHNSRSYGGGGILDSSIIGIRCKNYWLYKHPNFTLSEGEVLPKGFTNEFMSVPTGIPIETVKI